MSLPYPDYDPLAPLQAQIAMKFHLQRVHPALDACPTNNVVPCSGPDTDCFMDAYLAIEDTVAHLRPAEAIAAS